MDSKQKSLVVWYKSIVIKQALVFIVTMLPNIIIFLNIYQTFQTETLGTVTSTTLSRDSEIFDDIYTRINSIEYHVYDLFNDGELYLLSDLWDSYDTNTRIDKILYVQERLEWIKLKESYINDIRVYFIRNNLEIYSYGYGYIDDTKESELADYKNSSISVDVRDGRFYTYVSSFNSKSNANTIRFICEIEIPAHRFGQIINDIEKDSGALGMILVNDTIYKQNPGEEDLKENALNYYLQHREDLEKQDTYEIVHEGEKYFCSLVVRDEYGIALLSIRAYNETFHQMLANFRLLPVIFLVNIFAVVIFLFYINKYIRKPVSILSKAFMKLQKEEERVIADYPSNDEFSILYQGFNNMSIKLQENIERNYLQKIELQRAQLKQLQAQIDPHFLYNTLFIIRSRITRKDYDGAESLSGLLSSYFHFLNRDTKDFILLENELEHTHAYGRIQSTRFSERLRYIAEDCPKQYKDVLVPRLILQPLIENAMKYGIENIEEKGIIHVYFKEEMNKLLVIIESSGNINEEDIDQMNRYINEENKEAEVTSIINIKRRLQLYYGLDYTLYYEKSSCLAGGIKTIVELKTRSLTKVSKDAT